LAAGVSVTCGRGSSPVAPSPPPDETPPPTVAATFTLTGTVTNVRNQARLADARVEIVSGATTGPTALTDATGFYRIGDLPSGEYAVRVSAEGFEPSSSSFTLTADLTLDFALTRWSDGDSAPDPPQPPDDRWVLAGMATDAGTRLPLPGVRIEVTDGANSGRTATTGADGRYLMVDLAPGSATIRATLDQYVPKSATIALQDDRTLDFTLERATTPGPPGPSVSGRTVDVLSRLPIAGVAVRIDGAGESTTDADGAFTVTAAATGGRQRITMSSASTVDRQTHIRVPGQAPTVTLIPRAFDLRTFDEMFRARGGLHRWIEAPRLVVQRRVLAFTNTTAMSYVATADTMSDAETSDLIADLRWALPQLTGGTFQDFAGVDVELAAEGAAVAISRPGVITVARYDGLGDALSAWGYGRWSWNAAGEVQAGAMLLDNTFELANSPYRRSLRAHEFGHTLGYDHVSITTSVMHISARIEPTPFDRDAATIAFLRRPLNLSPDIDPDPITVNGMATAGGLTWAGAR
jgi:hypothetical protein